jgi:glycosyltransferase involved in cell wall biosynthesis
MSNSAVPARTQALPDELELSVVIPCLNEARTLQACIEKALDAIGRLGISGEVVVADNGSTDGSQEIATACGARVVPVPARGYGNALRYGIAAAKGHWIVFADADDTYDFGQLDRFVAALAGGADFVMGTRLPPGEILPGANPWLNRNLGTPVLTFVLNRLFGTRIRDVNCGMRGIGRNAFRAMNLQSEGMEFASEMVVKAALHGIQIAEVPVTLHPDRRGRPPHLRRWHDGWRHLEFLLLHAPDQLLFAPGLVAFLLGLALSLPVSLRPIHLAGRMFDFHFLFGGGALALVGLQGVLGNVLVRDAARGAVLRPNRIAAAIANRLTLFNGLVIAATLFGAGFALDATVLFTWVQSGFGPLVEVRRSVMGLLLLVAGAEVALFSFLHAVFRKHV